MTLDLSILPPKRRRKVLDEYWTNVAAERIREVYPVKNLHHVKEVAMAETAKALRAERAEFAFVTARWVRAVMYEGR